MLPTVVTLFEGVLLPLVIPLILKGIVLMLQSAITLKVTTLLLLVY